MDDDLSVPQAFAVLHETVRNGNAALTEKNAGLVGDAFYATIAMLEVLGLNPWSEPWVGAGHTDTESVIDALVQVALQQRQEARARKDFAASDAIRDGLDAIGIRIEDTPQGARWTLEQ
jgi:cysteinyl-tRNA synthetase